MRGRGGVLSRAGLRDRRLVRLIPGHAQRAVHFDEFLERLPIGVYVGIENHCQRQIVKALETSRGIFPALVIQDASQVRNHGQRMVQLIDTRFDITDREGSERPAEITEDRVV